MLAGFVAIVLARTVIAQDTQPTPQEGDRDFQRIQDEQRLAQERNAVLMRAYLDAAQRRARRAGREEGGGERPPGLEAPARTIRRRSTCSAR